MSISRLEAPRVATGPALRQTVTPLLQLARWLPHRAARRLGELNGAAFRWQRDLGEHAEQSLRLAWPDLDAARISSLARQAAARSAAVAADAVSASRFDAVELCRRSTLEGWDHLDLAQRHGRGVLILSSRLGLWQLAAVAVGLYRGPMPVIGSAFAEPPLRRWLDSLEKHHGQRALVVYGDPLATGPPAVEPTLEDVARRLASGALVACAIDPVVDGAAFTVPFLGRQRPVRALAFRAACEAAAAVVPIYCWPAPRGTYRVEIGAPVVPGEAANPEQLIQGSLEAIEQAIRRRPELWPWHLE